MSSSAGDAGNPPTKPSRGKGIHLFNPLHAGLQVLTDVLALIPGPHQARILPARSSSRVQSVAAAGSAARSPAVSASPGAALGPGSQEDSHAQSGASGAISKEELGRATWMLLHGVAAQFPDHPSRQEKKDVKQLVRWACPPRHSAEATIVRQKQ